MKAPGFGDNRKAILEDIGVLTGGVVFNDEYYTKLQDADTSCFGSAKSVTITKDNAILLNGEALTSKFMNVVS